MACQVINSSTNFEENELEILPKTEETYGTYLDFREAFRNCVESIFFTKMKTKTILNLEIVKRDKDYSIKSEEDLEEIGKLFEGYYESNNISRETLTEAIMGFWINSENFKYLCNDILKFVESPKDISKYKVLANLTNCLPTTNLREVLRFVIYEHYKPVELTLLNMYAKEVGKIYKTDKPLVYFCRERELKEHSVMFSSNHYRVNLTDCISIPNKLHRKGNVG